MNEPTQAKGVQEAPKPEPKNILVLHVEWDGENPAQISAPANHHDALMLCNLAHDTILEVARKNALYRPNNKISLLGKFGRKMGLVR